MIDLRRRLNQLKDQNPNNQLVLLITNPRSGSTWLLDSLRCHPAISILPEAIFFQYLGLSGRRYPRDLAVTGSGGLVIETHADQRTHQNIPEFRPDPSWLSRDPGWLAQPYWIEKLHPHFFDFEIDGFMGKVDSLAVEIPVRIIYHVRDPRASLDSFFGYQQRNPAWNKSRTPSQVMAHMKRIYQAITEMADRTPGLILDYSDLVNDFDSSMVRIYRYLWPGIDLDGIDLAPFFEEIRRITARERRSKAGGFIGDSKGLISDTPGRFDEILVEHKRELNDCQRYYNNLLESKDGLKSVL